MPRPSRKRVVEEIDLTGDDDDVQIISSRPSSQTAQSSKSRPPKHARTSDSRHPTNPSPRSSYQGSSQAYPYALDDDEDEEDGAAEAPELSQNYNDVAFRYERYGVLATKIVGVRYYSGVATVGEMVVLQREPHNPYDSNAIQVIHLSFYSVLRYFWGLGDKRSNIWGYRSRTCNAPRSDISRAPWQRSWQGIWIVAVC